MAEEVPRAMVPVPGLAIPEYYVDKIPDKLKSIYEAFDVKFVHVKANNKDYFIYDAALVATIGRLKLYVDMNAQVKSVKIELTTSSDTK